ncbi:hypothetical protein WAI453_008579 [Rhynchosporium graminicola]
MKVLIPLTFYRKVTLIFRVRHRGSNQSRQKILSRNIRTDHARDYSHLIHAKTHILATLSDPMIISNAFSSLSLKQKFDSRRSYSGSEAKRFRPPALNFRDRCPVSENEELDALIVVGRHTEGHASLAMVVS